MHDSYTWPTCSSPWLDHWGGHWAKVVQHKEIYLNVSGFGGSFKYVYQERLECHRLPVLIYAHCHVKYLPVVIVVHRCQPTVVAQRTQLENFMPFTPSHGTAVSLTPGPGPLAFPALATAPRRAEKKGKCLGTATYQWPP